MQVAEALAFEPSGASYQRRRPEQPLLYQLIEQHYPVFLAHVERVGRKPPRFVQRKFEDYLKCGRLESAALLVDEVLPVLRNY